jgi:hypothetical protein
MPLSDQDEGNVEPTLLWSEPLSGELKSRRWKALTLQIAVLIAALFFVIFYPYLFYRGFGELLFLVSIEVLFILIAALALFFILDYTYTKVYSTGIRLPGDRVYDILHHKDSIIDFKDIHMAIYEKSSPPRKGFIVLIGDFSGVGMTFLVEGQNISEVEKYIHILIEKGIRVVIKKDWQGTPTIEEVFKKIMKTQ